MIDKVSASEKGLMAFLYSKSLFRNLSNPTTLISVFLLSFIIGCAIFAPFIAPTDPYDLEVVSIMDGRLAPGEKMFNGNIAWLGTDGAGRDVLSAIIFGLRTSLIVAISSALIALGIVLGKLFSIGRSG